MASSAGHEPAREITMGFESIVQPVRRGRSFQGRGGLGLTKRERGGGTGGATQSVRENYKSFKEINGTVLEGIHQFSMYTRAKH